MTGIAHSPDLSGAFRIALDSGYPHTVPSQSDKRIGLFGGSFNPPHVAHQLVCTLALSVARVDEVWLMPCYRHAFDKELAPYADRVAMCRLAAEPFGPRVLVSEVERELGEVSRTLVTLEHLRKHHPDHGWVLVVGADILAEAERWYAWDRIQHLAELFVVGRQGGPDAPGVVLPDVSSSDIRARLARGEDGAPWVGLEVMRYIQSRGLYSIP